MHFKSPVSLYVTVTWDICAFPSSPQRLADDCRVRLQLHCAALMKLFNELHRVGLHRREVHTAAVVVDQPDHVC